MSVHKLTAGSGYDYLTRQVAAMDATEKGHTGLASYYTERGETPGQWVGSGMAGIDGLAAGDIVTAEQMQALFGSGHHPLAAQRLAELEAAHPDQPGRPGSLSVRDRQAVTRLGAPYKVFSGDVSPFRLEVAKRIAAINADAGLPGDWPVPAEERARVRTEVGREFFLAEHGREPLDARELAGSIARQSRPRTTAVAGYDLTFSPVKSVSALWAIAPPEIAARIERAHQGAVSDALRFIETHALYTRTGTDGVRQVDVRGLVGTAFTHRDSRAGDPDLHTHVAIANKVQTLGQTAGESAEDAAGGAEVEGGRWLAIDGRILFKAVVTASETYNTALETRLRDDLGVQFDVRGGHQASTRAEARKRPVREVVGFEPTLLQRWSARRASIEVRQGELATEFQGRHGRPPTAVEALQLAQQATLETRDAKHEPSTLAEQRAAWRAQAEHVLGGAQQVQRMLGDVLQPSLRRPAAAQRAVDVGSPAWLSAAADRTLTVMQERRSTWQVWHVRAEAQRQVRSGGASAAVSERAVDALVEEVLQRRSVSLAVAERDTHGRLLAEPGQLRRLDGSSVYRVAGADLLTSAAVLGAEQQLVATAGRRDGRVVEDRAVDVALLEATANGTVLNAGQVALVRQMATSGARLQLGIAPAGSGKTTAMSALAAAWTEGGGYVVGLAPSAAAAAALREQTGTQTETLAKLTWSLSDRSQGSEKSLPEWAQRIDETTLVVIDEAGMADTMSLAAAVSFVIERGGSVRLVGDDQQLAAIGAGGVLRDIAATHGAVHLSELLRFADPAEGAATLALREGRPEALGFYLDHNRVHVGDLTTMTGQVFQAWQDDRAAGLDSIMLAPTHDLVADLNQRARTHRLSTTPEDTSNVSTETTPAMSAAPVVIRLADGLEASAGDLLITRTNDRSLRTTSTDWVKNGDRWTLTIVHDDGSLTAQHLGSGRSVQLPAAYVQASVELGYATTVHTAQGVSVDTMHGLAGGEQSQLSRQQLYTMLTRGRIANHVYLEVVGDGDPHSVIRPEVVRPLSATDHLEAILARDGAPTSASTLQRDQATPAVLLGQATARYVDALHVAAQDVVGPDTARQIDAAAADVAGGLQESPAWPALRAHLMLLAAGGTDPVQALHDAATLRSLDGVADPAAVLDWRLDATGSRSSGPGPLPWLPAIPAQLGQDGTWGAYLTDRADLVVDLAAQVTAQVTTRVGTGAGDGSTAPVWLQQGGPRPPADVVADVEVWRAAMQVEPGDRRPTGPAQLQKAALTWQRTLQERVENGRTPAVAEWGELLRSTAPAVTDDAFTPVLAEHLAGLSRAGIDARALLVDAAGLGPLPDDHAAAAMWWRISRHVSPAVAPRHHEPLAATDGEPLPVAWADRVAHVLGSERAQAVQASPLWPALVAVVEHGLQRGWQVDALLDAATPPGLHHGGRTDGADAEAFAVEDTCLAMVWRASVLTDPSSSEHLDVLENPAPVDLWDGVGPDLPLRDGEGPVVTVEPEHIAPDPSVDLLDRTPARKDPEVAGGTVETGAGLDLHDEKAAVAADLAVQARLRDLLGAPEPSAVDVERLLQRAYELETSLVSRERVVEVNQLALAWFQDQYRGSWAQQHLQERFGRDVVDEPAVRPGYAPSGWNGLVSHLRHRGVDDEEMLAAGVAITASTGRLIDRFRDRAVLSITHHGDVLGFVGRRHPDVSDTDQRGPKYLNTATTVAYVKGAQLYVAGENLLGAGAVPVIVEGPMDAIAVTLATSGSHVGVAPLGTALTDQQAAQLAALGSPLAPAPVVATDGDLAGRMAAERAYWTLTLHGLDPAVVQLPAGADPADLYAAHGAAPLQQLLDQARPLGQVLVDERLTNLSAGQALVEAMAVAAARPSREWSTAAEGVASRLDRGRAEVDQQLLDHVRAWNADPRRATDTALQDVRAVRERLQQAAAGEPTTAQPATVPGEAGEQWRGVAGTVDPRLVTQDDWLALAHLMQDAADRGHDVPAATQRLVQDAPLGDRPAQELRYRLVAHLQLHVETTPTAGDRRRGAPATEDRERPAVDVHPSRSR
ncbi:MobF family relaxase [Aquipuribacter hungaricus]|uniref:MobF family relaxase n=1 Tax=Aquipuribacter hungaricus TaxID=545624 RepID=A0ABV7WD26_9MICO